LHSGSARRRLVSRGHRTGPGPRSRSCRRRRGDAGSTPVPGAGALQHDPGIPDSGADAGTRGILAHQVAVGSTPAAGHAGKITYALRCLTPATNSSAGPEPCGPQVTIASRGLQRATSASDIVAVSPVELLIRT